MCPQPVLANRHLFIAKLTVSAAAVVSVSVSQKYIFSDLDGLGNPLISGFYIGTILQLPFHLVGVMSQTNKH